MGKKKYLLKKINYKMIVLLSVLILAAAGCGKAKDNINTEQKTAEKNGRKENAVFWQADYARLEEPYDFALTTEDHIYGCCLKDGQVLLYSINKSDFSVIETYVLPDADSITGMAADQKGNVYILGNKGDSTGFWKNDEF